jgi:hypothetical protein
VLSMEMLHWDEASHFAGSLSHVLVGTLLLAKAASVYAHKLSVRHKDQA